jgi:hypothetical protein
MLYADKQALETELKVSLLAIRERELDLYVTCFRNIGTMAGLFAGFALQGTCISSYSGASDASYSDASEGMRTAYLVMTTIAMDLNVAALFAATSCAALGPGLALRGPDGSMDRAVEGLALEFRIIFLTFCLGVLALYISTAIYVVITMDWLVMALLLLVIALSMRYTSNACGRIYKKFRLPAGMAVGGNFHDDGSIGIPDSTAMCRHAALLDQLSRDRRINEWPRRQWLSLLLVFDDFVGVSAEIYEERYQAVAKRPDRWYNKSVVSILRHLERPSHLVPGRRGAVRFARVGDGASEDDASDCGGDEDGAGDGAIVASAGGCSCRAGESSATGGRAGANRTPSDGGGRWNDAPGAARRGLLPQGGGEVAMPMLGVHRSELGADEMGPMAVRAAIPISPALDRARS